MIWKMKNWLLRLTEPWREEQASLDLEWRIFAQKHNAAGKRPLCYYSGMEQDGWELNPMEKVHMYEFPDGDDNCPPDSLRTAHSSAFDQWKELQRKVKEKNDAVL